MRVRQQQQPSSSYQYHRPTRFSATTATIFMMLASSLSLITTTTTTTVRRSCVVVTATTSSRTNMSLRRLAFVSHNRGYHYSSTSTSSIRDVIHTISIDQPNSRSHLPTVSARQTGMIRQLATLSTTKTTTTLGASSSTTTTTTNNDMVDDYDDDDDDGFFARQDVTFESIGIQSPVLLERLQVNLGLTRPTQIQAKAFATIRGNKNNSNKLDDDDDDDEDDGSRRRTSTDVTIGAETGSGKTLAYLLPLLDDILTEKAEQHTPSYDYARAVILVPNKELVQQVLRMAVPLCGGTLQQSVLSSSGGTTPKQTTLQELATNQPHMGDEVDTTKIVRLAVLPGGLNEPLDFKPFRDCIAMGGNDPPVDIVICTPAALGPFGLKPKLIDMFADIRTLVVDEADMLLDGGYIRQLENVLMGFRRADRLDTGTMGGAPKTQHIFCAATLPDMGLKSVDAYLQRKFPYAVRIQTDRMHNARHYGLAHATQWNMVETKRERMEKLVELLNTPVSDGGLMGEKVMVFLNSVEDVEGAYQALEQKGIKAVPYHAKVSLDDRATNLDRFRKYDSNRIDEDLDDRDDAVSVLVCTDLASRGLDVPGVTAIVQLQFAGNVVSHLHRMGRCGRAGQRVGRGIVFFNEAEADLVDVVKAAERQQERMQLEQDVLEAEGETTEAGKVNDAFSRKRGFTKKKKKLKREGVEY